MEEEIESTLSGVAIFKTLPVLIQQKIINFFMCDEWLGVDVEDVRCTLSAGKDYKVFYSVVSLLSFISTSAYEGVVSYKMPLDTLDDFSDWADTFMPKILEDDVFSTVMFSFDMTDDFEFYVVVF
ncbi:hypothetical protein AB4371_22235 [Vibrio sp. 10N.261.51.A3]|uniref:hypothetical protein n=1 Tax=Vibrio TaxID=662 RepID=UPI000375EA07|nr:hypothetical protein [Vibrio crassostreae]OEE88207.1 hypothetical protein A140_06935 [Vibrio crassostreae 9ZC88]